jgi:3-ketoacyl-CoA synthase
MAGSRAIGAFTQVELDFMDRIMKTNGLGEETYFPPGIISCLVLESLSMLIFLCCCFAAILKLQFSMSAARQEAEMVIFGAMDRLLERTGIDPKDIDIVITNCSLFCPTPSLSAMVSFMWLFICVFGILQIRVH